MPFDATSGDTRPKLEAPTTPGTENAGAEESRTETPQAGLTDDLWDCQSQATTKGKREGVWDGDRQGNK